MKSLNITISFIFVFFSIYGCKSQFSIKDETQLKMYFEKDDVEILKKILNFYDSFLEEKYPDEQNKTLLFINDWKKACKTGNSSFNLKDSIQIIKFVDELKKNNFFHEIVCKRPLSVKSKPHIRKWLDSIFYQRFKIKLEEHVKLMINTDNKNLEDNKYYINWGGNYYYSLYQQTSDKEFKSLIEFLIIYSPDICSWINHKIRFISSKEDFDSFYKLFFFSELVLRPFTKCSSCSKSNDK